MFEPTRQHAILAELAQEIGVPIDDPRLVGTAIALYGASGNGGRVGAANLPADYRHVTLTNSPARAAQAQAYELIGAYAATFARQFTDDLRVKSLYMWSAEPGTGKTTSACAVLNAWIREHYIGAVKRGQQPQQRPAYFASINRLQTQYNAMTRPGSQATRDEAGDKYRREIGILTRTPFLVFDDLAVRSYTAPFLADMHEVINERVTNHLPIVFTSNVPLTIESYEKAYGKLTEEQRNRTKTIETIFYEFDPYGRTFDRVRDQCVEIPFAGESKRGLRK
jgi:DNA replication protein DnaC